MITVLKFDKNGVFLIFIIISTTAPTSGLILGAKVSEMLGGYTGPHALKFCFVNSIIASFSGIPIPFIENSYIVVVLFWLMLFFGAAM